MTDQLPDGVYLNLDEEVYFAQDALGSTDLVRLFQLKEGWWWQSRHNPDRQPPDSKALTFGKALHAILLEGVAAYEARFVPYPDKPADAVDTIADMKAALRAAGFHLGSTSDWTRPDWAKAMRQNLPRRPCWFNILEDFYPNVGLRLVISLQEDRMLRLMRDIAVDPDRRDNAEVRTLFEAGSAFPPLSEVSILYTLPGGLRRRARIDRMFPKFDVDLKSLAGWTGRPLRYAVGDTIAKRGYDIQRADYWEARRVAYRFIEAGQVYGGSPEERSWLASFPQQFPRWDWVWLFYQKPEPSGRAPVIFPVWDDTYGAADSEGFGTIMSAGRAKCQAATLFYRKAVAQFGLQRPWARVEQVHYTDPDLDPAVIIPHWIDDLEPNEDPDSPSDPAE